ncbi:MAG: CHAT domain-containing protein, partial [Deltaproteobacteria bacterium]|nr:CHAT domain-containing protein [Deltaproteobacteria bacterium]
MRGRRAALIIVLVLFAPRGASAQSERVVARATSELVAEADRLLRAGRAAEAAAIADRAVAQSSTALGWGSLVVAGALERVIRARQALGQLGAAEAACARALPTFEWHARRAPGAPIAVLTLCGRVASGRGAHGDARARIGRALALVESSRGPDHPDASPVVRALGEAEAAAGRFRAAEDAYGRAIALRERAVGPDSADLAPLLVDLAALHGRMGAPGRARALLARALAMVERAYGAEDPRVATVLDNLAQSLVALGDIAQAEPLAERALAIRRAAGPRDRAVGISLSNLGSLYRAAGELRRAERTLGEAVRVLETATGAESLEVATALNNLGTVVAALGDHARARPLHERALAIRRRVLGDEHPEVASSLANLALVLTRLRRMDDAERLCAQALAIREHALGREHPLVATSLNNLASIRASQGEWEEAEALQRRAIDIHRRVLGETSPAIAGEMGNLARLLVAQGRDDAAVGTQARAFALSETVLRVIGAGATEARTAAFLDSVRGEEWASYSLALELPRSVPARRLGLAVALLRKGRALDEAADTSRAALRDLGPEERAAFVRLREIRSELATLVLRGPTGDPTSHLQRISERDREARGLEAQLARRSAAVRARTERPSPERVVERVRGALPPDGALVEIVAFPRLDFRARDMSRRWGAHRYAAFVLLPDGAVHLSDLGDGVRLEAAVARFRSALADPRSDPAPHARRMWSLVGAPILRLAGERRRLFVSLDGALQVVPLEPMADERGRLAADRWQITYLTSGRDLLRRDAGTPSSTVVVLADPHFDPAALPSFGGNRLPALRRLPGTRRELDSIRRLHPRARSLVGIRATDQALLAVARAGILHIATHGVFLESGASGQARGQARALHVVADRTTPARLPRSALLRSALLLAPERAEGRRSRSDGLLTALEVAGMDLWGTQLVVLSACDTGRGGIAVGEGVYGLRRAFFIAGAETVVTSLWQVSDESTTELMTEMHRELRRGRGRTEALALAARALRARRPHPYYWAPFVVLGRAGPLRG